MEDYQRIIVRERTIRVRIPGGDGPFPVVLLLHGWTGDEDAMWVFSTRLPKNALLLAPRGQYIASPGGFSWYAVTEHRWPHLDEFNSTNEQLLSLLDKAIFPQGDFDNLHLIGFSQGAAACYAFTLFYPELVASVAGLAGFMPEGALRLAQAERLKGLPAFVTHGTQDRLVPVERAREAVQLLEQAGAKVSYCEDDVGHKLSASCFRGLERFYQIHFSI